jgi:hypothetical protein
VHFYGRESRNGAVEPLKIKVRGVSASSFDYVVPPRGVLQLQADQAGDKIQVGSVRVAPAQSSSAPSGLAIFSYSERKIVVSSASVPAMPPGDAFRMYVESAGAFGKSLSMRTGVTIANPSNTAAQVQLTFNHLDGTSSGHSASIDLPAGGQVAQFIHELAPSIPADFRGVMKIRSSVPVTVSGLRGRYNEQGAFLITTIPAWNEATPASSAEINFPHIVNGGGYTTKVILLSTDPAGATSAGKMWIVSKDGSSLLNVTLDIVR